MESLKLLMAVVLICGLAASDAAWAERGRAGGGHFHHHHARTSVLIAGPLFYPWWYPWPAPYYAPPPQVYVEQGDPNGYWYYCADPAGYYPTVDQCAGGWVRVLPRPAE